MPQAVPLVLLIYPLKKAQPIYFLTMIKLAKSITFIILLSSIALTHSATISIDSAPQSGDLTPDQVSGLASIAGGNSNDGNEASTTFDANALDELTQNIDQMLSLLNLPPSSESQDPPNIPDTTSTNTATNDASTTSSALSNSFSVAEPSNQTSGNDGASASDAQSSSNSQVVTETDNSSSSSGQASSNSQEGTQPAEQNTTATQSSASQKNETIVSNADNGANNEINSSASEKNSSADTVESSTSSQTASSEPNSTATTPDVSSSSNDQPANKSGLCSSDQDCVNAYGLYVQQGLQLTCNSSGVCEAQ